MFLKNKNIIFKIRRSKVTVYAALTSGEDFDRLIGVLIISSILLFMLTKRLKQSGFGYHATE